MPSRKHTGVLQAAPQDLVRVFQAQTREHKDAEGEPHLVWTGAVYHDRTPMLYHEGVVYPARHVAWVAEYQRPAVGRVRRDCAETLCVDAGHLTDSRMRQERLHSASRARCGHQEELEALRARNAALEAQVDDLEERLAANDYRLRGILLRPRKEVEEYVLWSNTCELPARIFVGHQSLTEWGFPRAKVLRADRTGTSSVDGMYGWEADGRIIVAQRGLLPMQKLIKFCERYFAEDESCWDMLTPFEDDE